MTEKEIELTQKPTREQKDMLKKARKTPITYDDDLPQLSAAQLKEFRKISEINREERRKQSVTLRLSPRAIKKARSLGKGYTSVLSRILESALEDNSIIERYL